MSVQAFEIRGIGIQVPYSDVPPIFGDKPWSNCVDDFLEEHNIRKGYYQFRDSEGCKEGELCLAYISDGMNGDDGFVGIIIEARYLENSHGDDRWKRKYRNDNYVKEYAKEIIKKAFGYDCEPKELELEFYQ